MKASLPMRTPLRKARRRGTPAFTLVEVLVAIAVLSFLLLILARMMGMVSGAYRQGNNRIDNFTKSRAMLDLIAGDLQKGVYRPDLPAFGTGSQWVTNNGISSLTNTASTNAFFTRRAGIGSNVRDLSLVIYTLDISTNAVLQRSDYAIPWAAPTSWTNSIPFSTSMDALLDKTTSRQVAEGVVAFGLAFQRQDGSLTNAYSGYNATNPVVAIGIGLAVVDLQTEQSLGMANLAKISSSLATIFSTSIINTNGIKAGWDKAMTNGFFADYPKALGGGLKTFERWVPCQPPF